MLQRYFNAYRLASYVLVLFTVGHTLGTVITTPKFGPASDAVVAAMKSVHMMVQGMDRTWWDFYRGMSASVSLAMLFKVAVTWYLGGKAPQERRAWAPLVWSLLVILVADLVCSWLYFF